MASFKDITGREWTFPNINALLIDKVREDCDPKFLLGDDVEKVNTATRLGNDPALLCHVVYLFCEKQREERQITLEQFYTEVLGSGEAIEAAGEAMHKAIANFTHPRKRAFVEAIASKEQEVQSLAMERALQKINDPELTKKLMDAVDSNLDAVLARALTRLESATDSPASSESTPPA